MNESLAPCPGCHRHVRVSTAACPFCDAALRAGGASQGAVATLAFGAMLALVAAPTEAHAQSPRELLAQAPASAYGAPPSMDPLAPFEHPQVRPQVQPQRPAPEVQTLRTVRVREIELRGPIDPRGLERAVIARYGALQRCVAIARAESADTLRASVTVAANGRVVAVRVEGASPRLIACVRAGLRGLRFPATGQPAEVAVTIAVERGGDARCPGPNPAGCTRSGCAEGLVCVTNQRCVPSSCGCSAGRWVCTSDCGGGVCMSQRAVPPRDRAPGL
jgi:hypothetical protein